MGRPVSPRELRDRLIREQQDLPPDLRDIAAWSGLHALWLPIVVDAFRSRYPAVDEDLIKECADKALIVFEKNPERWQRRGCSAIGFLLAETWDQIVDKPCEQRR